MRIILPIYRKFIYFSGALFHLKSFQLASQKIQMTFYLVLLTLSLSHKDAFSSYMHTHSCLHIFIIIIILKKDIPLVLRNTLRLYKKLHAYRLLPFFVNLSLSFSRSMNHTYHSRKKNTLKE